MTSVTSTTIPSSLDRHDQIRAGSRTRACTATVLLAVVFVFVWLFSLSRSLFDPIGYDQALYQYITDQVATGRRMYVDVWFQNTPGIIGIHWLSTHLVGRSPLAFRVFDAGWQLLTIAALVALAVRDGRRWSVGWLAAMLYVLAYYGMGYIHTAQREGFIVLPLLLAAHAVVEASSCRAHALRRRAWATFLIHAFAGVMSFVAFAIKPPMGLCFGVLWLHAAMQAGSNRSKGVTALAGVGGLTAGFVASVVLAMALLIHWNCWEEFWRVLIRADMPAYIDGPRMCLALAPSIALGLLVLTAILTFWAKTRDKTDGSPKAETALFRSPLFRQRLRIGMAAAIVLVLLVMNQHWLEWRNANTVFMGLWLPALGSVLVCFWAGRSTIWRVSLLLLLASLGALILQGKYFLYHYPPLFAFAGYLSAHELMGRLRCSDTRGRPAGVWVAVCLATMVYLGVGFWWPRMTRNSTSPHVLAGTTLEEHYTRITKRKRKLPDYTTTRRVAQRVQELTAEHDPIAVLLHEARLYYFSQRPPAHRLVITQPIFSHMFEDFMRTIDKERPKILLARVPDGVRRKTDRSIIQSAVFDDLENYFGPCARVIREGYVISEVIDDICILSPNEKP